MNVGVEAARGALVRLERELDDAQQVRPGREATLGVEPRELRVRPEAGEERLEAVELRLCGGERGRRLVCLDEQLDRRAHGAKAVTAERGGKRVHHRDRGERPRKLAVAAQVSAPSRLSIPESANRLGGSP